MGKVNDLKKSEDFKKSDDFPKKDNQDEVRKNLEMWYVKQAKEFLPKRVYFFGRQMQESVNHITIKNQKKRWGSCSSARNLNFNWHLIMAPQEVVDYVVVHELCHLRQMNHSAAFWSEVERILPDYRMRKKWLDENGRRLDFGI